MAKTVAERLEEARKKREQGESNEKEKDKSSGNSVADRLKRSRAERTIGFDTITDDVNALNDTINAMYSGWQDAQTMESNKDSLSAMLNRLSAYTDYMNSYGRDMDDFDNHLKEIQGVYDAFNSVYTGFDDWAKMYGQFNTAKDYDKYIADEKIGWGDADADVNAEMVSARKQRYDENLARIAELDAAIGNESWFERVFNSGDVTDLRSEKDSLEAENRIYDRTHKEEDGYYHYTEAEDFADANRDYINPTKEALWDYDVSAMDGSQALSNGGSFDEEGNIRDAKGNIVQYANAPKVEDKLGFFLSASEEDVTEAYNRLSSSNGNYTDTWANLMQEGDQGSWNQLDPTEIGIYYYLLDNEGQESAYKFLDGMTTELNRRATAQMTKDINEAKGWEQVGLNLASVPAQVFGGAAAFVDDAIHTIKGEDINPYSKAHSLQNFATDVRSATADDLNQLTNNTEFLGMTLGEVYSSVMSAGDSAMGAAIGGTGYGILMGMGAASSKAKELYEKGASRGQIAVGGILAGAAEMVFEKYSIDNLINMGNSRTIGGIIWNGLKQGGIELTEEMGTEIANTISDAIVMGSQSEWNAYMQKYTDQGKSGGEAFGLALLDVGKNVWKSGIGGFISGFLLGGAGSTVNYVGNRIKQHKVGTDILANGNPDALKQLALDVAGGKNKRLTNLATKTGANSNANTVGRLALETRDAINAVDKKSIVKAMMDQGMTKAQANKQADYIIKGMQNDSFTDADAERMESDVAFSAGAEVAYKQEGAKIDNLAKLRHAMKRTTAGAVAKDAKTTQEAKEKAVSKAVADNKLTVSNDGKAVNLTTGKAIESYKFDSITDGKAMLRLDTDEVVSADEISFPNVGEALVVEALANIGMNAEDANFFIESSSAEATAGNVFSAENALGISEAFRYGKINYPIDAIPTDSFASTLTKGQIERVYQVAQKDAVEATQKAQAVRDKQYEEAVQFLKNKGVEVTKAKGKVTFAEGAVVTNDRQQALVDAVNAMSIITGADFELFRSNGKGKNGSYNIVTGKFEIDLRAGFDANSLGMFTISHELGHFIKEWSPAKFKVLADIVVEEFSKSDAFINDGVTIDYLVKEQIRWAKENGLGELTWDQAYEEVICDALESLLVDGGFESLLNKVKQKDPGLFEKIVEFFNKLFGRVNALDEAYQNVDPDSTEANIIRETKGAVERINKVLTEAIMDAGEKFSTVRAAKEAGMAVPLALGQATGEISTDIADVSAYAKHSYRSLAQAAGFDAVEDEMGRRWERMGKKVTKVTVDDIRISPIGALIQSSVDDSFITEEEAKTQRELFAGICTLAVTNNDFALSMEFAGTAVFTAMKANSDKQYNTTYDFPSICTKTQAVIDSMSAKMVKLKRGLTHDEIIEIYQEVFLDGNPVPCPECYVFSRWIGIGSLLDNMYSYQTAYAKMSVAEVRKAYEKQEAELKQFAEDNDITFGKAKGKFATKYQKEYDKLLEKVEKARNQGENVKPADEQKLALLESKLTLVKGMNWIKNVYFAGSPNMTKMHPNAIVPVEILFDLNKGNEFALKYADAWAFRTTQGAGYGKAITPYADTILGEGIMVTQNTSNTIKKKAAYARENDGAVMPNPFTDSTGTLTREAREILKKAQKKMKAQSFLGGQRIQSTSDARPENFSDYLLASLELQAMGGMGQGYTKVAGAVPTLNAWGWSINQSLMPKYGGVDAKGNLIDTAVGGMNPKTAFENRQKCEYAGTITIGVNDEHCRALMHDVIKDKDGNIIGTNRDFGIPYHASGGNADNVAFMRDIQEGKKVTYGDLLRMRQLKASQKGYVRSTDYTRTQGDKILSNEVLRWLGKTEAEIQQIHDTRDARIAILTGKGKLDMDVIRGNRFLSALYDKFKGGEWDGVTVAKNIIESQIFPNEFWNESLTFAESGQITKDYLEYCDSLGFLHRFSGQIPSNGRLVQTNGYDRLGNKVKLTDLAYVYDENGNKTDVVEDYFWMFIVDRRMYGNQGQYLKQRKVTVTATPQDAATTFAKSVDGSREYNKVLSMQTATKLTTEEATSGIGEKNSTRKKMTAEQQAHYQTEMSGLFDAIAQTKNHTGKYWSDKTLKAFFAEHPDVDFVEKIYKDDKSAVAEFKEILASISDEELLNDLSWYVGETYKDKGHTFSVNWETFTKESTYPYRGAVRKFRNAIKSRVNEIMTQKNNGTNLGVVNGKVTLDDMRSLFAKLNTNTEMTRFAEKVFDTADELGVSIEFVNDILSKKAQGVSVGDIIQYKTSYFNDTAVADQSKAEVILHEVIHACTSYALYAAKNYGSIDANRRHSSYPVAYENLIGSAKQLNSIYEEISRDPDFKGEYGIENVHEMVAELSNPVFVEKLQKKNLWDRIVDAICKLFGVARKTDAYSNIRACVDYLLENFDSGVYEHHAKTQRSALRQHGRYDLANLYEDQNVYSSRKKTFELDNRSQYEIDNGIEMGININDSSQPFTDEILNGDKTIETRDSNSLKPYIGKRVALVRTGVGKATVVGYATIGEPKVYTSKAMFDADFSKHRVGTDSPFYFSGDVKYGYPLTDVVKADSERELDSKGIVGRSIRYSSRKKEGADIGYHAGDLGKAESLGQQGYYRDTGHFGTGTYFVGNQDKLNGYNRRNGKDAPIETVDFAKYNLFKPLNRYDAKELHDFLRGVDGFYRMSENRYGTEAEMEDGKETIDEILYDLEATDDTIGTDNFTEKELSNVNGNLPVDAFYQIVGIAEAAFGEEATFDIVRKYLTSNDVWGNTFNDVVRGDAETPVSFFELYQDLSSPEDAAYDLYKAFDDYYLTRSVSQYESWNKAFGKMAPVLNVTEQKLRNTFSKVKSKIAKENLQYPETTRADSAATLLMKELGYEGIDVRHIPEMDNTTYGSVIYDLKGEDLARKQEIGTARYSSRKQPANGKAIRKVLSGTFFSGGGTVDFALSAILDSQFAVEYEAKISTVYQQNNDTVFMGKDVLDFDPEEWKGKIDYFHASPVCKTFSKAISKDGKAKRIDTGLDMTTAEATAKALRVIQPNAFTLENVPAYVGSDALKLITDVLDDLGYKWDIAKYNSADYGAATSRDRVFIRAVKDGELPAKPQKVSKRTTWYDVTKDLIPGLKEKDSAPNWLLDRLKTIGIDVNNLSQPLYVSTDAPGATGVPHAFADSPAPTITANEHMPMLFMPDGRMLEVSPRMLARISGLPDNYQLPPQKGLSKKIIGNGVPVKMTQAVVGSLLNHITGQDVVYSTRKQGNASNRYILANALEKAAKNPTEKEWLSTYKANYAEADALEQQLLDVNRQIKELTFGTGPKDRSKLAELKNKQKILVNKLKRVDGKLLQIEASKPLADLLAREKARVEKAVKAKAQKSRQEAQISRNNTIMRHKIQGVVKDIDKLLNRGNKDKNVKLGLQDTISKALQFADVLFAPTPSNAEVLRSADVDMSIAEESSVNEYLAYVDRRDAITAKLKEIRDGVRNAEEYALAWNDAQPKIESLEAERAQVQKEIDRLSKDIAGVIERARRKVDEASTVSDAINNLAMAYKKLEGTDISYLQGAYDEFVYDHILLLEQEIGKTKIRDMNAEQLRQVYDMFKMMQTAIRDANKLFLNGKKQEKAVLGYKTIDEVTASGKAKESRSDITAGLRKFGWNTLTIDTVVEILNSSTLKAVVDDIKSAQGVYAKDTEDAKVFFAKVADEVGYWNWDKDKTYTFTSTDGGEFSIGIEAMMLLYAYQKRKQAVGHLEGKGFSLRGTKKSTKMGSRTINESTTYLMMADKIAEVVGVMENEYPGAKKYVDALQGYLSTTMGAKGNEVSEYLYGIDLFVEQYYVPLMTDSQFLDPQDMDKKQGAAGFRRKNSGFTKATVKNATKAITLGNFTEVWAGHVVEMANYHAMVIPLDTMEKLLNFHDGTVSVHGTIEHNWGSEAVQYLRDYINDLNGGIQADKRGGFFEGLIGLQKMSAVALSASVVVQQPTAIFRAMQEIDPKYFLILPKRNSYEQLKQYSPIAVIKQMGGFDTHTGRGAGSWIVAQEYKGLKGKAKGLLTDKDYRSEAYFYMAGKADEVTWSWIWQAILRETKAKHPNLVVGSKEFMEVAGKRADDVLSRTQVYDSTVSKSGLMRSSNGITKMATAFMGEPTVGINNLVYGFAKGKHIGGAKGAKYFAGVASSVVAAQIAASLAKAFIQAGRDDDEDKDYWEKYLDKSTDNLVSEVLLMIPNSIPYVRDLVSMWQGWDIERTDMALLGDLIDAIKAWDSDRKTTEEKISQTAGAIGNLFGIPIKNVYRDIKALVNVISEMLS